MAEAAKSAAATSARASTCATVPVGDWASAVGGKLTDSANATSTLGLMLSTALPDFLRAACSRPPKLTERQFQHTTPRLGADAHCAKEALEIVKMSPAASRAEQLQDLTKRQSQ